MRGESYHADLHYFNMMLYDVTMMPESSSKSHTAQIKSQDFIEAEHFSRFCSNVRVNIKMDNKTEATQ